MSGQDESVAMVPPASTEQQRNDRSEIELLYHRLRLARDMGWWEQLVASYHPDTILDLSWFRGTPAEFIKATTTMASRLNSFHEIGPSVIEFHQNRATVDTMIVIHLMSVFDGVEVDCVGYCRERLRVEKREDKWLFCGSHSIYLYDTLIPTNPAHVPQLDEAKLAKFRPSYRFLSYMLDARGLSPRDDQAGSDRPETVKAVYDADDAWLRGSL